MNCVLVGNYGVGNLGDEALREYFLQEFPSVDWAVLSAKPEKAGYARLPAGLRSFLSLQWVRTIGVFWQTDVVVFGGGSLFTDVESPYACFLWWVHAFVAVLFNKPFALAFQGIGPFHTKRGEWFARWTVRRASFISVRDEESAARIETWRKSTKIVQTFDPIFSLLYNKKTTISSQNVFIIIPRKNSSKSFLQSVQNEIKSKKWEEVKVLLMEPENKNEQEIAQAILSMSDAQVEVLPVTSIDSLVTAIQNANIVYTQRFHGAIAALALGVPVEIFPQGAGDKLAGLIPYAKDPEKLDELERRCANGQKMLEAWLSGKRS